MHRMVVFSSYYRMINSYIKWYVSKVYQAYHLIVLKYIFKPPRFQATRVATINYRGEGSTSIFSDPFEATASVGGTRVAAKRTTKIQAK